MFGLSKIYTMGIVAIVAVVAVTGIYFYGHSKGYDSCQAEHLQAQIDQLAKDAETVEKIEEKANVRTKTVIKWKTKIKEVPVSDCLKRFPDERVDRLRDLYNGIKGSKTDG